MKIGYARVSSKDQDVSGQQDVLKRVGCAKVYLEKVSGSSRALGERTELARLIAELHPGDQVVCTKADRLGRSVRDLLNIIHDIDRQGASVTVMEPAITTDNSSGRMLITVLGMVAEMELGFIRSRTADGIARARAAGRFAGKKPKYDWPAVYEYRQTHSLAQTAKKFGCTVYSVYRICAKVRKEMGDDGSKDDRHDVCRAEVLADDQAGENARLENAQR